MGRYDELTDEAPLQKEGEEESEGDADAPEEGFLKGYTEDEEVEECAECGGAVGEEQKVAKEIEGESYTFCSKHCKEEFEESFG